MFTVKLLFNAGSRINAGSLMVTASDLHSTGRGFDSQPFHYQLATLGKLFTHVCLCHQAV